MAVVLVPHALSKNFWRNYASLSRRPPGRAGLTMTAVLAATVAAPALAQATVQIFGSLDVNISHTSDDGGSSAVLDQGGIIPSRLGFRGTEDWGGGLSVSFWLECH